MALRVYITADAAVFEEWVEGSKVRELAAKYKIGVEVVLQVLDKFVPEIDDATRRRLVGREILRLEELYRCYFSKGRTDIAAAQLCLQLSRRFAELVGLDSAQKLDIRQVTSMPQERLHLARKERNQSDANGFSRCFAHHR